MLGALVMVAHHRPIEVAHHIQLPLIGKVLFDSLTIDPFNRAHSSIYSHILFNILDGVEAPEIQEIIDISQTTFPSEMHVIVTRFIKRMKNRYLKQSIKFELESIFPEGYSVQFKGYLGILVPYISKEQREELQRITQEEDISVGVSWPFTEIMDFKMHFDQAVATIKLSAAFGEANAVHHYDRFATFDLLRHYQGNLSLENYCHPAIAVLEDYDATNNTDLFETLRVYLLQSKKLTTTAEELFIHKNSLHYRLQRIVELTSLDLDKPETLTALLQTYAIKRFLASSVSDRYL